MESDFVHPPKMRVTIPSYYSSIYGLPSSRSCCLGLCLDHESRRVFLEGKNEAKMLNLWIGFARYSSPFVIQDQKTQSKVLNPRVCMYDQMMEWTLLFDEEGCELISLFSYFFLFNQGLVNDVSLHTSWERKFANRGSPEAWLCNLANGVRIFLVLQKVLIQSQDPKL